MKETDFADMDRRPARSMFGNDSRCTPERTCTEDREGAYLAESEKPTARCCETDPRIVGISKTFYWRWIAPQILEIST